MYRGKALLMAIIMLVGLCGPAHALTKIKVGHLVALDMAPLFVAKEAGIFEKNGLDAELFFFANPGDNNAALAGGAIDFSINPFTLPFFAANSGLPFRVICGAGGWGVMQVVVDGTLGINNMDEFTAHLKSGKKKLKIGTLQGDTLELILTRNFDKYDIPVDAAEMIYFNDLLAMVDAFRTGQIDVLSHIKPYTTDMVVNKGAVVITDNAATWAPFSPNCVISVMEKTLDGKPELVEAFLKSLLEAADLINSDPEKAVSILSNGTYYRVPPEVLLTAFKTAPAPISFVPDVDSVQSVVTDLTTLGYIKGDTSAADIFRLDTIKGLQK